MSTTPSAPPAPRLRHFFGVLRLLAGLAVLASIVTQITDQMLNGAFVPEEYFSYFTIQSSLINIVVLLVGGWLALRRTQDPPLFTSVRMSVVAYAVVTGVVYNVLLRNIPSDGFVGIRWPNEVIHVWIPIIITVDWILAPGRPRLEWRALWIAVSYPLAWVAFTLVRGAVTGWFPYPFLEPATGAPSVTAYIVGIAAFIVALASGCIALSRTRRDRAPA